jgi:hypothetical protein
MLEAGRTARNIQRLIQREVGTPFPISLGTRLRAWRHGNTGFSSIRYGLPGNDHREYVSDYARYVKTPRINGRFGEALNNKLVFSRLVRSYGCEVPDYFCIVSRGEFVQIGDRYTMWSPADVIDACRAGGEFVIKPYGGGSGVSVHVLTVRDGKLLLDWSEAGEDDVLSILGRLEEAVILEFVHQHEYSSRIFPHSTNSIRVLTMWDYEADEPFIPFAGHRFGRPSSVPVDNCSQGGIACFVHLDTGTLGPAYAGHMQRNLEPAPVHPDTGVPITGTKLPHWEYLKSKLLEVCREMAYIPYVGWDVVITEKGFTVIEGNNYPDLGHQNFEPLLVNPRVRAFFEAHDAL